MRNDLFYKQIKENALNKPVIGIFEKYANTHADFQMYIITAPLGEKYEYQYEDRALIVLVPSHKLLFINLSDEEESFLDYVEDVIQDLNSMCLIREKVVTFRMVKLNMLLSIFLITK